MIDISFHNGRRTTKKDEKEHLMCYIDLSSDIRVTDKDDTSNRVRDDYNNLSNEFGIVKLIVELCIDGTLDFDKFSEELQVHMSVQHLNEFSCSLQKAAFERVG